MQHKEIKTSTHSQEAAAATSQPPSTNLKLDTKQTVVEQKKTTATTSLLSNDLMVFQDCTLHIDFNKGHFCHLTPKQLNASVNVYDEALNSWDNPVHSSMGDCDSNTLYPLEMKNRESLNVTSTGLKFCHTILIKKVSEPVYWVMHVSPESSRRQYDTKTKTAIDDLDFSETSAFIGELDMYVVSEGKENLCNPETRSRIETMKARVQKAADNKAKPAYIDVDPAHIPTLDGVGLTKNDEVDVHVVHTGVGFNQDTLIERLNAICKVHTIKVTQRERSKLVGTPNANENYFYGVTLQFNPSKPSEPLLVIQSQQVKVYKEEITNPFAEGNRPNLTVVPNLKSIKQYNDMKHDYPKDSLGNLLIQKHNSIPVSLINIEELRTLNNIVDDLNDSDCLIMQSPPDVKKLGDLNIKSNTAYIFVGGGWGSQDQLFYINKNKMEVRELFSSQLKDLRWQLFHSSSKLQTLSDNDIDDIISSTKQNRLTKKEAYYGIASLVEFTRPNKKTKTCLLAILLEIEKSNKKHKCLFSKDLSSLKDIFTEEELYFTPSFDLMEIEYFYKEYCFLDTFFKDFVPHLQNPCLELLPASGKLNNYLDKIIFLFKQYAQHEPDPRLLSAKHPHQVVAKELFEFFEKNKDAEPLQIKNWLYHKFFKYLLEGSLRKTFTIKPEDMLCKLLFLGIHLCEHEIQLQLKQKSSVTAMQP